MARRPTWSSQRIHEALVRFTQLHGRYPTAHEIDDHPDFPSSKHIQRRFGGLIRIRQALGVFPEPNLTKASKTGSQIDATIERTQVGKARIVNALATRIAKGTAHMDVTLTDDQRTRVDFRVGHRTGVTLVTVVAPKDRRTLLGCLKSKEMTYSQIGLAQYAVIIVVLGISSGELDIVRSRRKRPTPKHIRIMSEEGFEQWLAS